MAKETIYFSHDCNSRLDFKVQKLIQKFGMTGYGIFWSIVEDLYINENRIPLDFETISYHLRVDENIVKSIVLDFGLFIIESDFFYSISVQKRLDKISEISKKNKDNIKKRWDKVNDNQEDNTTVLPNEYDRIEDKNFGNTIKEKESKENKRKEKKENINENEKNMFEQARKFYLGSKKGLQTELDNFVKKYPDDWQTILPLLLPAMIREKIDKEQKLKNNGFNQQWKNFSTWINGRCWEIEYPNVSEKEVNELGISVTTNESGEQKVEVKQDRSSFPLYSTLQMSPHAFPEGTESRCGYYVIKNKECVRTNKY